MNEEPPTHPEHAGDDPVEARIVAWVLGEASAFEAAELERLCEEKPELLVFRRRMRELHGLLTEAEAAEPDDTWKLPAEKRKVLDEIFGQQEQSTAAAEEVAREKRVNRTGRRAMLAIAACVTVTFFVVRLVPSGYEAEATIEIKPRSAGVSPLGNEFADQKNLHAPHFFGTEFERIKGHNSLGKVVDQLNLTARWGIDREAAIKRVRDSVRTENIKGTDLISIRVREKTGQDAREITTAVTQAYADYRREIENRDADKALFELKKAVRDQEDKVEERRKVLATIVRTKGIIYKGQDSFYGQSGVDEDQGAKSALETYNQLTQEKMQTESQLQSLQKYSDDQLMVYAAGLDLPDNSVRHTYPLYLEAQRGLEELKKKGLGEGHPSVKAAEDQIHSMKKQLDEGVVNTRATLQAQLDMATDRLNNVQDLKDNTREDTIKRGLDAQDYVDAKRDFETDQELLQQMRLKEIDRTIRDKMTDDSIVIHEQPKAVKRGIDILGGSWFSSGGDEEGQTKHSPEASLAQTAPATPAAAPVTAPPAQPAQTEEPHLAKLEDSLRSQSKEKKEDEVRYKVDSGDLARTRSAGMQAEARQQQLAKNLPPADAPAPPPAEPQAMPELAGSAGMKPLPRAEMDMSVAGTGGGFGGSHSPAQRQPRPRIVSGAKTSAEEAGEKAVSESATAGAHDVVASNQPPANASEDIEIIREFTYPDKYAETELPSQMRAGANLTDSSEPNFPATPDDEFDMVKQLSKSKESAPPKIATYAGMRLPESSVRDQLADQSSVGEDADSFSDGPAREKKAAQPPAVAAKDSASSRIDLAEGEMVSRSLHTAEGNFNLGKYDDAKKEYEKALETDPTNSAARRGLEKVETAKSEYLRAAYDHTRAELLAQVDAAWELSPPQQLESDGKKAEKKEAARIEIERRNALAQADLAADIVAADNPYSTFSLNISDASFQVARAAIEKGERPDPGSIKPEQFYNAVDYGDPAPSAGEPVAATIEQSAHPVTPGRSLVRVAVRTGASGRSAAQPLRLTLLVDQSGSMVREDRRAAMDSALSQLSGLLTKADVISVIGFSRTPHLLAEGMAGDKSDKLASLVNQTASEGGTNLEEAMKLGGQIAARHQLAGAQNRIVLFTDGAANLGDADPARLAEQVKTLRQKGISFDIAGIAADDLNDRLLGELARNGNGRYYVVGAEGKEDTFARQLAGAFRPAAENVKIQVIFNPRRVAKYKLIGFEKDRLKTEDFRNDSVDAAELAAEETGTAIYQVEEIADGAGEIGELSVRFRDTASGEMVERSWTLPHATSTTAFDRATPSMQLAGLSLLAAEKLRGGPLADAIDFKQLSTTLGSVKQYYGSGSRAGDMLRLIDSIK